MNVVLRYKLLVLLVVSGFVLKAQSDTLKGYDNELSIIPFPAIAYNPTNGWLFGVAPGASWYMGPKLTTNISSGLGSIIYTTNKQWIITAKTNVFLKGDSWNLLGDWRYFITSQPTFGLGTGPQSAKIVGGGYEYDDGQLAAPLETAQMMEFNYLRLHETVLKRHEQTRLFYGLGYHLDIHSKINDNLLDIDNNVYTSHFLYQDSLGFSSTDYTLSGISVNVLLDSRDNVVNPYSGRYAYANIRINPTFMGSDKSSTILWLEYRDYIHLNKDRPRHLIGFWTYGWFITSGDVPYIDLPAIGWDQFGRSGRAYTQGRFRGEDLWYGEIEYRVPLQRNKERFGAVAFVNGTTASNRLGGIGLFDYLDIGYGAGLRIMINEESRANISLDYAWGKYGAGGFYFGINEVF